MSKWQKFTVFLVALLDQATKLFVRNNFYLHESREMTRFFSLTYVQNTGVAFGMFQGGNASNVVFIFIAISVILVIAAYKKVFEERGGRAAEAALALVFGGAMGNLIDRVLLGSVVDFFDFHFFPIFNVADCCITIGGTLLFASLIFSRKRVRENVP
jgi:signal peptidase II